MLPNDTKRRQRTDSAPGKAINTRAFKSKPNALVEFPLVMHQIVLKVLYLEHARFLKPFLFRHFSPFQKDARFFPTNFQSYFFISYIAPFLRSESPYFFKTDILPVEKSVMDSEIHNQSSKNTRDCCIGVVKMNDLRLALKYLLPA